MVTLGLGDGEILRIKVFNDGSFSFEQREDDGRVSFGWTERFGDDARSVMTLREFLPHLRAWVDENMKMLGALSNKEA